jgi:prolyl oligopeptidase
MRLNTPEDFVIETIHGVTVADPYQWLEDPLSFRTRTWIEGQTTVAGIYFNAIPNRARLRTRVEEFLAVETYDSLLRAGTRYFYRKRLPHQEQPCVYFREGAHGPDELLIDPDERHAGKYLSFKPLCVSFDGRLLLYEMKNGGERAATFEILEVDTRRRLADTLPHGFLRGFAFSPDGTGFYYVHEASARVGPQGHIAYYHRFGTGLAQDVRAFSTVSDKAKRLHLVCGSQRIGFLVSPLSDPVETDFYVKNLCADSPPEPVLKRAEYRIAPRFVTDRILAITDRHAPNYRIVEIRPRDNQLAEMVEIVPEDDSRIQSWTVAGQELLVSYVHAGKSSICVFDLEGRKTREFSFPPGETVHLLPGPADSEEVVVQTESFTQPKQIRHYARTTGNSTPWLTCAIPFEPSAFQCVETSFPSRDGTRVPIYLVARHDLLNGGPHPVVMTAYGGHGIPAMPQFSVFVALLLDLGCVFALPCVRGGSDLGAAWHNAGRRQKKQTVVDDFLSAADWLIQTRRTVPSKFAIFGGSHSGLLVGAAMTQRPDLFRAVVCIAPLLDMIRYHLFDQAQQWKEEFGTAEDPLDFSALLGYSPYHNVQPGTAYPATLLVSGDADQNCNPLHARKMTARLQDAQTSGHPVLLRYNRHRGHSPVLPLSDRVEALTDRLTFVCHELGLSR